MSPLIPEKQSKYKSPPINPFNLPEAVTSSLRGS